MDVGVCDSAHFMLLNSRRKILGNARGIKEMDKASDNTKPKQIENLSSK